MADDQNKPFNPAQGKPSTIDDLVKELSKNGNPSSSGSLSDKSTANQGPPPNLPGVKIEPRPQAPTAPAVGSGERSSVQSQVSVGSAKPSAPPPPLPSMLPTQPERSSAAESGILDSSASTTVGGRIGTKPPTPPFPKSSPVQEYRSSIRTMGEDITSIKAGQKPSGVDVPRRVTPEMPKAVLPGAPEMSAPTGPISSIGLGRTEKTGPLAGLPKPPVSPSRPGLITGLGQSDKTGPLSTVPAPQKPSEPLKPPGIQPTVTVPKEKKSISTIFYLLVAGVLLVGGALYWFYFRSAEPVVLVPTPSPTQTVTPTPVIKDLSNIFTGVPVNFEVVLSDDISGDFRTFINALTVAGGDFLKVDLVQNVDGTLVPLDWLDMFDIDLTAYPFGFKGEIVDSATLIYGQTEMFSADGLISYDAQNIKKTVLVARVSDAVAVETMMMDWELTIADDLADYLFIEDTSKEESVKFLDNTYRGVAIRYKNFPFPDVTVDYSIIEVAGQSYLVVAGSREAMYAALDALLEQ